MAGLDKIMELAPWAVAATVLSIVMIVLVKILGARSKRSGAMGGMMMQDIDKMVKAGTLTAEEAKEVRRKMAERITEKSQAQANSAAESAILIQAQYDPDAVRQLLTPEALADAERKKALLRPDAKPQGRAAQAAAEREAARRDTQPRPAAPQPANPPSESAMLDPLGGLAPAESPPQSARPHPSTQKPAQPAMNMPRVVKEKHEAAAGNKQLDIDAMFEQGRISREEYEQLKMFFKDKGDAS